MNQNNSILRIIPNVLTSFRSLAAIVLPVIIIYGGEIGALMATPILIIAGISDYFDGFYARKYNVTSNFGKILDIGNRDNFCLSFRKHVRLLLRIFSCTFNCFTRNFNLRFERKYIFL